LINTEVATRKWILGDVEEDEENETNDEKFTTESRVIQEGQEMIILTLEKF
jgi:hypothetical protein